MNVAWKPGMQATVQMSGFGGLPLAVRTWGHPDDPAVVLLHNGTRTKESWTDAGEALGAAGRHVIAFDLRGHGKSGRASDGRYDIDAFAGDLIAVLESLPSRPVVIGASLGGVIALAALGGRSEQLASGLVLVDAALAIEGPALEKAAQTASAVDDWDRRIHEAFDRAAIVPRLEEAARAIRIPTLVLRGAESEFVTPAAIERLRTVLPDAEYRDIEGSGHFVVEDELDRFNAAVLEFLERCVPREPVYYETGSAPRVLRDTLGCFATGISVVTTVDADGAPAGCTVNSFTSISLDPPLVLLALDRRSRLIEMIEARRAFAVNVLHIGQQPTSALFASGKDDRFSETPWETWDQGVPILTGSLAAFECTLEASHEGGDHRIFIGRVLRGSSEPRRDPLLYFRGKYRRLHLR